METIALPLEQLRGGLAVLLEAYDWASGSSLGLWQFAVKIDRLREAGLSDTHLSWLVGLGYIEHSHEFTPVGDDERVFRQQGRLNFRQRSSFMLSAAGVAFARPICRNQESPLVDANEAPAQTAPAAVVGVAPWPKWDLDRLQLTFGDELLMQLSTRARNLQCILDVFEEDNWPPRIDDPITGAKGVNSKRRLRGAIEKLNENLLAPIIRFFGDGSGKSICWKLENGDNRQIRPG